MKLIEMYFGFYTADAEEVEFEYKYNGTGWQNLEFSFTDYEGIRQTIIFRDALALRWDYNEEHKGRGDSAFEVVESDWLQFHLYREFGIPGLADFDRHAPTFAHYRLCFNTDDLMLDVVARRIEGLRELRSHPPAES